MIKFRFIFSITNIKHLLKRDQQAVPLLRRTAITFTDGSFGTAEVFITRPGATAHRSANTRTRTSPVQEYDKNILECYLSYPLSPYKLEIYILNNFIANVLNRQTVSIPLAKLIPGLPLLGPGWRWQQATHLSEKTKAAIVTYAKTRSVFEMHKSAKYRVGGSPETV